MFNVNEFVNKYDVAYDRDGDPVIATSLSVIPSDEAQTYATVSKNPLVHRVPNMQFWLTDGRGSYYLDADLTLTDAIPTARKMLAETSTAN